MVLAAYARYSSDNQKTESIEEQFREIDEWAVKEGHSIVTRYSDYALSGKFDYRPQFQKMLTESKSGRFSGVVVFDLSRFSRGGEYGIIDALKLQENDVQLFSVTETYGNDFGGKLIKHVKFLMAEEMIEKLRTDVARGMKDNALKCKHNGGIPPLGYDVGTDGCLVVNEEEAAAIRLIFEMYGQQRPYDNICAELNRRGYKTKRNRRDFGKTSLHEILINKKYIGVYEFGKIRRVKLRNGDNRCKTIECEDHVAIEGGCPAIIGRELWDRVQQIKTERKIFDPRAKADYMLKGKVICGECGGRYCGTSMSQPDKDYYYVCGSKKTKKICHNRNIKKVRLEAAVIEYVREQLFSDLGKRILRQFITDYNNTCEKVDDVVIRRYEAKIKAIDSRIARAKEAYLSGDIELSDFRKIRQDEECKKCDLVRPRNEVIEISDIKLDHLLSRLEAFVCSDRDMLNSLVDKVIVTGETISVILYKNFLLDYNKNDDGSDPGGGGKKAPSRDPAASLSSYAALRQYKENEGVASPPPRLCKSKKKLLT